MEPALALTNVTKRYGSTLALDGVNLEVAAGEVHGVLGENGAGKSTLIGVAAGATQPDEGSVVIGGHRVENLNPWATRDLGLALVSQHPTLLPHLTAIENMLLVHKPADWPAVRERRAWATGLLAPVDLDIPVDRPVAELPIAQRALIQIARALSLKPKVLILDEPTEPLVEEQVELLFTRVRELAAAGTAVVYISHRIPEIKQIADRITVLRNGRNAGPTVAVDSVDEAGIVAMIVGREAATRDVLKNAGREVDAPAVLEVTGLSSPPVLAEVSMRVGAGEIVGLAGVSGNGQETFIRGLAGLAPCDGAIAIGGTKVRVRNPTDARHAGVAYIAGDRQLEGVFPTLSVAKNVGLGSFARTAVAGLVVPARERRGVAEAIESLAVRTSGPDALVSSLSGGNQQKVVLARALAAEPRVLLADEPTSGVDVGSRSEIYDILRRSADSGVGVVVLSTDAPELETLCDRVLVFSRGHVVKELTGDEVTRERITQEMVMSTQLRRQETPAPPPPRAGVAGRLRLTGLFSSQYGGIAALVVLMVVLGIIGTSYNSAFLSSVNIGSILIAWAALASISFGQQLAILLGGIDLSVGPLTGMAAVVGSFYFARLGDFGSVAIGLALMVATVLVVGVIHFLLIWRFRISAVGVTLATYVALQGLSLLLRPSPAGEVDQKIIDIVTFEVGWLPVVAVLVVLIGVALEFWLRYSRLGTELRAVGSNEPMAGVLGVRSVRVKAVAFIGCSLLTIVGSLLLLVGSGIGDASQGIEYTLNSVVAVVLGGAALAGGRGSFVGVMVGALLLQQAVSLAPFLQLNQAWNTWFPGILLVLAGIVYSISSRNADSGKLRGRAAV